MAAFWQGNGFSRNVSAPDSKNFASISFADNPQMMLLTPPTHLRERTVSVPNICFSVLATTKKYKQR